jgi:hypothetical protein
MSPEIIHALKQLPPSSAQLMINPLSQEVALQPGIQAALLLRRLLITGAQVPIIAANGAAQSMIHASVPRLDQTMQSLLLAPRVRQQLLSRTAHILLQTQQHQNQQAQHYPHRPQTPLFKGNS